MAQASRRLRKIRRIKRERSLAFRMLEASLNQRDFFRALAGKFAEEVREAEAQGFVPSKAEEPKKESNLTVTKVDEPETNSVEEASYNDPEAAV